MRHIETWVGYRNWVTWNQYRIETITDHTFDDKIRVKLLNSDIFCNQKLLVKMVWNESDIETIETRENV